MQNFNFLFELEKSLHTFEVRASADKIHALLSPNFFEFGSSGISWTRQDILDRLPKEAGTTHIDSKNFQATILAQDIILVTYISIRIESNGETEFLRSSIWRKNQEGWQMEFHQGTVKR